MGHIKSTTWKTWSEIEPSGSEMSLRPSKHVWDHGWHFLDSCIASLNSSNIGFNPPLAAHPLHYPPHPLPPVQPLIRATHDITVVVKKVAHNLAVLAS